MNILLLGHKSLAYYALNVSYWMYIEYVALRIPFHLLCFRSFAFFLLSFVIGTLNLNLISRFDFSVTLEILATLLKLLGALSI